MPVFASGKKRGDYSTVEVEYNLPVRDPKSQPVEALSSRLLHFPFTRAV